MRKHVANNNYILILIYLGTIETVILDYIF